MSKLNCKRNQLVSHVNHQDGTLKNKKIKDKSEQTKENLSSNMKAIGSSRFTQNCKSNIYIEVKTLQLG